MSGLIGKRVSADVPGLGDGGVHAGSGPRSWFGVCETQLGPVPWRPAELSRSEARLSAGGGGAFRRTVAACLAGRCLLRPPFNGQLRTGTD